MARPRVRTERLAVSEVTELRSRFGTFKNAYRQLFPTGGPLDADRFRLAAGGHASRPDDLRLLRDALATWKRANLRVA